MIPEHIITNFNTLTNAFANKHACIVEVEEVKTGEPQYLICVHRVVPEDPEGKTEEFLPFALIFKHDSKESSPYELYKPPTDDQQGEEAVSED